MEFEWDESKRQRTLSQRGLDFRFAQRAFDDPFRLDRPDARRNYGEERRQIIGRIEGRLYFVAYTMREDIVRIISARKAHDKEEKDYQDAVGQKPVD